MERLAVLLMCVLTVHANLRGAQEESPEMSCIARQGSCDPVKDRCCQGPGLMTCRLRPTLAKGDEGLAYVCGEEFPLEDPNSKCAAEGQECRMDDQCCQIDPTLKVTCQKVGIKQVKQICKAKLANTGEESAKLCVSEGGSCNPLENACCQEGPQGADLSLEERISYGYFWLFICKKSHKNHFGLGWDCGFRSIKSISGEKGLRTCQLKFFEKPGEHGMAYSCAREH